MIFSESNIKIIVYAKLVLKDSSRIVWLPVPITTNLTMLPTSQVAHILTFITYIHFVNPAVYLHILYSLSSSESSSIVDFLKEGLYMLEFFWKFP